MAPLVAGLRYEVGSTVVPGDRLGTIRNARSGIGTYVKAGIIYSSLVGELDVVVEQDSGGSTTGTHDTEADHSRGPSPPTHTIRVRPSKPIASVNILTVGQVAIGRVVRITRMQAFVDVLATMTVTGEAIRLPEPQQGSIRREDVRTGASEQVHIHESFLPGDLVVCKVLAVADQRRYALATSEPELGVIYAESKVTGLQMSPSSWKEMSCPETGVKEPRKCARPRVVRDQKGID